MKKKFTLFLYIGNNGEKIGKKFLPIKSIINHHREFVLYQKTKTKKQNEKNIFFSPKPKYNNWNKMGKKTTKKNQPSNPISI